MVTKKMNTVVKPIAAVPVMRTRPFHSFGNGGMQILEFAKRILDKYTKILNYQFDYTALVFLEHAAQWKEQEQAQNQILSVTCNLLAYCIRSGRQEHQISNVQEISYRQMITYVEQNLEFLRQTAPETGRQLAHFYHKYQELIEKEREIFFHFQEKVKEVNKEVNIETKMDSMKKIQEQRNRLLEQVLQFETRFEQKQNTVHLPQKPFMAPVLMSRTFFSNLHHFLRENRMMNFRQLWKWQNTRQLNRFAFNRQMSQFLQETDMLKQEEQLIYLLQQHDSVFMEEFLEHASPMQYQNILNILHVLTDTQPLEVQESVVKNQFEKTENISGTEIALDKEKVIPQKTVFEQYQQTMKKVEQILQTGDEITENLLREKVEEYKELFFDFIRIDARESEDISTNNISNINKENIAAENPEIFSDAEIELLLNRKNQEFSEFKFVQKKLDLIAWREVTELFLAENHPLLQRACMEQIAQLIEPLSFEPIVDILQNQQKPAELPLSDFELTEVQISKAFTQLDSVQKEWLEQAVEETEESILKAITQLDAVQKEQLAKEIQREIEQEIIKVSRSGVEENIGKRYTSDSLEDVIRERFTNGTLEERKLYYRTMEQTVDEMLISMREQGKETQELQPLLYLKEQLVISEGENRYRTERKEDWKFLLQKETGERILKAAAQLDAVQKDRLEREIQKNRLEMEIQKELGQEIIKVSRSGIEENIGKRYTSDSLEDVIREQFTNGTLEERKLYYRTMEQTVDEMLISMRGQGKETHELQPLLHLKEQLVISEGENRYRTEREEDWKFLLQKETGERILKATAQLDAVQKDRLEREIQKNRLEMEIQKEVGQETIKMPHSGLEEIIRERFTNGTPEDRVLYYHTMEQAVDKLLISMREQGKETQELQPLLFLKEQFVLNNRNQLEKKISEAVIQSNVVQNETQQEQAVSQWQVFFTAEETQYLTQWYQNAADFHIGNNIQTEQLQAVMETGSLPERKLLYISMANVMDRLLIQASSQPETWKEREQVLLARRQLLNPENAADMEENHWEFLMQPQRIGRLTKVFDQVDLSVQNKIIEGIRQELGTFYTQTTNTFTHVTEKYQNMETIRQSRIHPSAEIQQNYINTFTTNNYDTETVQNKERAEEMQSAEHIRRRLFKTSLRRLMYADGTNRQYETQRILLRNSMQGAQLQDLLLQDLGTVFLTQYNVDFMRPPVGENRNRFAAEGGDLGEQTVFVLAQPSTQKEGAKKQNNGNTDRREQERIIRQLEGDLLDYKNELRNRTRQIQEVEQKLINQQKEMELFKESHQTVTKQIKTASDRNRMMNRIKEELLLERMRSGIE